MIISRPTTNGFRMRTTSFEKTMRNFRKRRSNSRRRLRSQVGRWLDKAGVLDPLLLLRAIVVCVPIGLFIHQSDGSILYILSLSTNSVTLSHSSFTTRIVSPAPLPDRKTWNRDLTGSMLLVVSHSIGCLFQLRLTTRGRKGARPPSSQKGVIDKVFNPLYRPWPKARGSNKSTALPAGSPNDNLSRYPLQLVIEPLMAQDLEHSSKKQ